MGKDRQSQQSQGLVVGLENIALIIFYDDTRIHLVHDQLVIFLFLDRLGFRLKKYLGVRFKESLTSLSLEELPTGSVFESVIAIVDRVAT